VNCQLDLLPLPPRRKRRKQLPSPPEKKLTKLRPLLQRRKRSLPLQPKKLKRHKLKNK